MNNYTDGDVTYNCPAFVVIYNDGELKRDSKIAVRRSNGTFKLYTLGDVFDESADVIDRHIANGWKLYFAMPCASVLTSHRQAKELCFHAEIGGNIRYAGKTFRIDAAPNDNVNLVEVA